MRTPYFAYTSVLMVFVSIACIAAIGVLDMTNKKPIPKKTNEEPKSATTNALSFTNEISDLVGTPMVLISDLETKNYKPSGKTKHYTRAEYKAIEAKDPVLLFDLRVSELYEKQDCKMENYVLALYRAYNQAMTEYKLNLLYTNASQFGK